MCAEAAASSGVYLLRGLCLRSAKPRLRLAADGLAFGKICTELFFLLAVSCCLVCSASDSFILFLMPPFGHVNYFW